MFCRAGAGLRPAHFSYLESRPKTEVSWFEVIAENFITNHGYRREFLEVLRKDYDLSVHGVSLNIASQDPLDLIYLEKLKKFIDEFQPFNVSDHLCWAGAHGHDSHELLPIPYTETMLAHIVGRVNEVQEYLGRTLLLENVSSYLTFKNNEMAEWEFLNQVVTKTSCKLLLDINNVYVNSQNHGFHPLEFLDRIDPRNVGQIHLAGFTDMGTYLYDTHSKPVHEPVWDLFSKFVGRNPNIPFMIEWDSEIPEFPEFEKEIQKSIQVWRNSANPKDMTL